jgi:hypothetical protein
MALQKDFVFIRDGFEGELIAKNAYFKVSTMHASKEKVLAQLLIFTAANGIEIGGDSFEFVPDMDGGNFIAQAYTYLKTLPDFAGATDC